MAAKGRKGNGRKKAQKAQKRRQRSPAHCLLFCALLRPFHFCPFAAIPFLPFCGHSYDVGMSLTPATIRKAEKHLSAAHPVFARVIKAVGPCTLSPAADPFAALVGTVISQ